MLGMLASLGIEKGKPFAPGARTKAILVRAAKKGLKMARVIAFSSRNPRVTAYEGRQWERIFLADSVTFETPTHLDLESRITYTYGAEWTSPAMLLKKVGAGSQSHGLCHGAATWARSWTVAPRRRGRRRSTITAPKVGRTAAAYIAGTARNDWVARSCNASDSPSSAATQTMADSTRLIWPRRLCSPDKSAASATMTNAST